MIFSLDGGRIWESPVQPACSPEKSRATFICLIAKGDYIIKVLLGKFIQTLFERCWEISIPISRITPMARAWTEDGSVPAEKALKRPAKS